jgi:spermidine synthase
MIPHLALAVISAAVLAYEVLLVRLFAIVQWHHFTFMAISIALLGFGISGTLLAIWQEWARSRFRTIFTASAILFGVSAPISFLVAQALPFNALAVVWEPDQLLYLPIMYLLLVVPFFFGATCIGISFVCLGDEAGRVYAYNLIGSAVGALGIIAVLFVMTPQDALKLVAILSLSSAAVISLQERLVLRSALVTSYGVLALVIWAALPDAWFALRISEYKELASVLKITGSEVLSERSGPLGLLTVVENSNVPFRYVPGLSLNAEALPPDQLGVFTDGGSMTAVTRFDGQREQLVYLDYTTDALAYQFTARPSVLVLGAGGGRNVLQAIYHQAEHIDAVELDTNMVRVVQQDYAQEAGNIYRRPDVHVHVAEARGFIASSQRQWDLIQIPLLDASGGGIHGLSETYIYTAEAFSEYIERIRPGGWLSITRWLKLPPRDTFRLFATALDALKRSGAEAPENQLMLIRGLNTTTLLVKDGAITDTEIVHARAFAQARSFDLCYHPQISADEANRYNVLETPYFFAGTKALVGVERASFMSHYKFDIAPVTDERPYFFNFLKWRHLPELLSIQRSGGSGLLELGSLILVGTLVQATILSALLILAPLWVRRRSLAASGQLWRVAGYFLALGLAFLFIEIAFIQKFILFLSHPLYAVAIVLTGFLLFAGIGSGVSSSIAERIDDWHKMHPGRLPYLSAIQFSVAGIITISLIYMLILPTVFGALLSITDAGKVLVSLALIAPLAFFMGMPFPLGLSRVWSDAPALVPWAWGVNGCASVLSAMLATLIAMNFGFSVVISTAAVLYACAAVVFTRPLNAS